MADLEGQHPALMPVRSINLMYVEQWLDQTAELTFLDLLDSKRQL